ncbi:transcription factor AP-4-like, partial [Tropilaelaps mercedesae]
MRATLRKRTSADDGTIRVGCFWPCGRVPLQTDLRRSLESVTHFERDKKMLRVQTHFGARHAKTLSSRAVPTAGHRLNLPGTVNVTATNAAAMSKTFVDYSLLHFHDRDSRHSSELVACRNGLDAVLAAPSRGDASRNVSPRRLSESSQSGPTVDCWPFAERESATVICGCVTRTSPNMAHVVAISRVQLADAFALTRLWLESLCPGHLASNFFSSWLGTRGAVSPKSQIEQEKRIRREIANSNERRRMQSINAGFQSLRVLLPQRDGEKMSKAAILQHTAEYIYQLEQEKTRLLSQLYSVKRSMQQHGVSSVSSNDSDNSDSGGTTTASSTNAAGGGRLPLKRKRTVESVESADEGIGMSPSHCERELISDLRYQLEREREMRKDVEKRMQQMVNERDGRVSLVGDDEQEVDPSSEAEGDNEDYIKEEVTEEFVVTDDLPQDLSCGAGAVNIVVPQPQEVTVISKPSVVVLPVHGVNMVAAQQLTPAPSPPRWVIYLEIYIYRN